ncbi:MAG: ABC transporter permease [Sedimentisphaerales bacterium]|nr:ABC transporter permease [Sedimentisphaerales bacterium]
MKQEEKKINSTDKKNSVTVILPAKHCQDGHAANFDWSKRIRSIVGIFVLLIIWQITAQYYDQPWIFPSVTRVLSQLAHPLREHYASGTLLSNTLISLLRVLLGFLFASIVGVTLGIVMGSISFIRDILEPVIELLRPLCPIAWLPFAIVIFKLKTLPQLFGINYSHTIFDQVQIGMIFVIFVGGFFPVLTNTLDGVASVRRNYLLLAKTLGASPVQIFYHVHLPAAMPMILTGLRQGLGLCWFVIIAAEMMTGSDSGIGYLLMYAADNSAMDIVIAAMLIIGAVGAMLSFLMRRVMFRFVGWKEKEI